MSYINNHESHANTLKNMLDRSLLIINFLHLLIFIISIACSGVEDQKRDWDGIHSLVCLMIASLRAPLAHANSEAERKRRKQLQQQTRVKELRRVWFP